MSEHYTPDSPRSASPVAEPTSPHAGDWAWLVGRWTVKHSRLQARLAGSTAWEEFDGTCVNWPTLGMGNVDDNVLDGRPVKERFEWTSITPTSAHWEQAFSADAGATWETNWRMQFTRA